MMNNNKLSIRNGVRGFSLIELMVVIAIAVILLAIGVPSFMSLIASTRLTSEANDLLADLRRARGEAASRGLKVVLCPSTDNGVSCSASTTAWNTGRMIFVDTDGSRTRETTETVVKTGAAFTVASTVTLTGFADGLLTFSPYGGLFQGGNPSTGGSFKLCSPSSNEGRLVAVASNGKPSVSKVACP